MLDAVIHDGPLVTAASFAAVLVLVLLLGRGRGAALIVGSLCVGVVWMAGAVAAAGVRINFLNFIALPITFGIAADYSANLYLRYRQEGRAQLEQVVTSTGGAVALCSLTTIIGYGSLLAADTEGLCTFGAAAILGEVACLATALVLMPAVIALLDRRTA
jgi:predicted RND superfamily exporter protein